MYQSLARAQYALDKNRHEDACIHGKVENHAEPVETGCAAMLPSFKAGLRIVTDLVALQRRQCA